MPRMSDKKHSPAMAFILAALKKDKAIAYGDLQASAAKKKLTIYPIMFGRAKGMLGLVKVAKRGAERAAKTKAVAARRQSARRSSGASKSDQIRTLLKSGMKPADIAKKVGCTVGLVYNVRSAGKTAKTRAAGRKASGSRAKPAAGDFDAIIRAVQKNARETDRLRKALVKIQSILQAV